MKKFPGFLCIIVLCTVIAGAGCGGSKSSATTAVAVTGVSLNSTTAGIIVGGTETLTAIIAPTNATNQNLMWSTDTPSMATVSSSGLVSGVSAGTANIKVTTVDGGFTATCAVTVSIDYTSPNIGTLKHVPAGSFQRDATASNISVISTAFRMSQNLITRAQFLAIMGTDPSNTTYSSGTSDPVQKVNWYQAIAFCNKLSIAEGLTPVYGVSGVDFSALTFSAIPTITNATWDAATATWSANGYRLPTEMEYMWAAMGATSDYITSDIAGGINTGGHLKGYAGSSETGGAQVNINNYAWTGNITPLSMPVGGKTPNELGLYDMSGNVWEWNWDWYGTYLAGSQTDYLGAASGTNRVMRGGSWYYNVSGATVAYRNEGNPYTSTYYGVGFRVVRP